MQWYLGVLKKYAVFDGRARRKEYWMFILFNLIVTVVLTVIDNAMGSGGLLATLYCVAVLLPTLAVSVRRLHDTDRSGWWLLIGLVPIIGGLIVIVFTLIAGTPGSNRFGTNPKEATI